MNANDVLKLVSEYNSHAEEIFDRLSDDIIRQLIDKLVEKFNKGNWITMLDVDYIGGCFSVEESHIGGWKVETALGWLLCKEEPEDYSSDLIPFDEKFFDEVFSSEEAIEYCHVGSFEGKELEGLLPLAKSLEKKGFECYYDWGNFQIVAFVKVK